VIINVSKKQKQNCNMIGILLRQTRHHNLFLYKIYLYINMIGCQSCI